MELQTNCFTNEEINLDTKTAGFIAGDIDTTTISDGDSTKDRAAINKMCTSIPTPFARLHLFRTAFDEVWSKENKKSGTGHTAKHIYNYLVADCLDMLEFIFYYGADKRFNVIKWNASVELPMLWDKDNLRFKATPGHTRLRKALEDALKNDAGLGSLSTIYLFTWDNKLVGGTSPFSLVYTGPNWHTEKGSTELQAGSEGSMLFQNNPNELIVPRALSERSPRFKDFIYKMWFVYSGVMDTPDSPLRSFSNYIKQSWDNYDNLSDYSHRIKDIMTSIKPYTEADFKNDYPTALHTLRMEDGKECYTTTEVEVLEGILLRCLDPSTLHIHEDYMIALPANDQDLPIEKSGHNAAQQVKRPLVLDRDALIPNGLYVDGESWEQYCGRMPEKETAKYWERQLPGKNVSYPYLRKEDFLQDKIIAVTENISKRHFMTGGKGDIWFLLPLKRVFFKYFQLSDIFRTTQSGDWEYDASGFPKIKDNGICQIKVINDTKVQVTLHIPLKGGETLKLEHVYAEKEIVYFDDADEDRQFNLSIFPFYRITKQPEDKQEEDKQPKDKQAEDKQAEDKQAKDKQPEYNKYSVMLGYKGDVRLHFYDTNLDEEMKVEHKERSQSNVNTRYYDVNSSFQLIEVEANGAYGLVVPLMKPIVLGTQRYVVCVDFGTTNTHIAYGREDGNKIKDIVSFTYNSQEKDEQVVSLFNISGWLAYKPAMKREFVPEQILDHSKDDEEVKFPIRTTACVHKGWLHSADPACKLFSDANVGFFFLNDNESIKATNQYVQNIKWQEGGKNKGIRQAFFNELMWMIKNKVVMNKGSMDFFFNFTYPQSMDGTDIDTMDNGWAKAREDVNAGDPKLYNHHRTQKKRPYEGIVPWYTFTRENKIGDSETYLNIDIGGGTMDMVYQDPSHAENRIYSAQFAANDLWGDGIKENSTDKKNNAFIADYKADKAYYPADNKLINQLDTFSENATDSADIISYLFKSDEQYNFTSHLKKSPLMSLLLMHFVSVAYYVGRVIERDELEIPKKIGFTGMGSLYIKIISPVEDSIAEIFKSVLRYQGFSAEEVNNLEIIFNDDPKVVTAKGGVIFYKPDNENPFIQIESDVWGYEGEDGEMVRKGDALDKIEAVLSYTEAVIDYFSSEEFSRVKNKLREGWTLAELDKGKLMNLARTSFKDWEIKHNTPPTDKLVDPLFFWPFKDLFFKYGRLIVGNKQ